MKKLYWTYYCTACRLTRYDVPIPESAFLVEAVGVLMLDHEINRNPDCIDIPGGSLVIKKVK